MPSSQPFIADALTPYLEAVARVRAPRPAWLHCASIAAVTAAPPRRDDAELMAVLARLPPVRVALPPTQTFSFNVAATQPESTPRLRVPPSRSH
jgi:hypothetical protein